MQLKKILVSEAVLQHPDFFQPFFITTGASNFAIEVVFFQKYKGSDLPIADASRLLKSSWINYSTIEKEVSAMTFCAMKFNYCIYGRHFTIITDHQP